MLTSWHMQSDWAVSTIHLETARSRRYACLMAPPAVLPAEAVRQGPHELLEAGVALQVCRRDLRPHSLDLGLHDRLWHASRPANVRDSVPPQAQLQAPVWTGCERGRQERTRWRGRMTWRPAAPRHPGGSTAPWERCSRATSGRSFRTCSTPLRARARSTGEPAPCHGGCISSAFPSIGSHCKAQHVRGMAATNKRPLMHDSRKIACAGRAAGAGIAAAGAGA